METQTNKQSNHRNTMLHATFAEERDQFRQNVETARRMRADIAGLRQQFKTQRDEVYAALLTRRTLREAFNRHLAAIDRPSTIIGRQLPAGQRRTEHVPQEPSGSQNIPPDELNLFLSALSDLNLDGKYEYIDELQSVLQRQELDWLERWARHGKSWLPPDSN